MSKRPLSYRLGLYISVAVLFVYSLFIIWVYKYNYMLAERDALNKALTINNSIVNVVREKIISTQEIAANMAAQIPFFYLHEKTSWFLQRVMEKYPFIWSVRIHMKPFHQDKGIILLTVHDDSIRYFTSEPPEFQMCLEELEALQAPLASGKPFWTEPFRCTANQTILSVYYHPIVQLSPTGDTLMTGFVSCQISLAFLSDLINEVPKGNGFAFLISDKGTYITHPLKEFVLTRNIYRLPREILPQDSAEIATKFVKNQQPVTVFPFPLNYQKSWAYPTLIPENGWIMAFVMPYKEFYKDLKLLLFRMVAVSFLVALLIFYLVFAISRRVMQPISKISKELHTFSIEKLDPGSGQNNETVLLQDSLERLRNQYEKNLQSEKEIRQRRERLRADMQLAAEIQASFIPPSGNHFLHDAGLSLHAVYKPMLMVSGDLFDFFMISDHKMLITIGDVSGDGIPAALFMGVAHTHIKSHAFDGDSKDIVGKVNKLLCKNNTNQFFLSLFLGILDLESDTLNYCNAGHTPTFLVQQTGRVKELGDPHGLPLGLYPDRGYKDNNVKFSKGDLLILYTDGLSEQINEAGDFFGTDNFYRVFDKVKNHSSEEVAAMILHEVNHFAGASAQSDDLSLLVLKYQ